MNNSYPIRKTLTLRHPGTMAACSSRPRAAKKPTISEKRDAILRSPTVLNAPSFREFFETVLLDSEVVNALHARQPRTSQTEILMNGGNSTGLQCSEQASGRASTSTLILPAEREVAAVCAFVSGLGLYMLHQSGLWRQAQPEPSLALHWAQEYRESILEIPLRVLRREQPELAGLMAEVLEMSVRGNSCNPEQVARILAAVRLATLPNQAAWLAT